MASQVEMLRGGLELLRKFLELTRETANAVEEGNFSACASLLQARAKLLEEFANRKKPMGPAPASTLESRSSASEVESLRKEMGLLYRKIAAYDQGIEESLKKEKEQVAEKLRRAQHGQRALRGYNPRRSHIPRFCDKQG